MANSSTELGKRPRQLSIHYQRRSLLLASMALVLSAAGCRTRSRPLTVYLLEGSVPATLLKEFTQQQSDAVELKTEPQLTELFDDLQRLSQSPEGSRPSGSALVSLGDYWLTRAIQEKLIRPLPLGDLPGWSRLPQQWQQLVTRNASGYLNDSGAIWAAPYRTGSLVIAYRQAELAAHGGPPTDWPDLWRDELAGRISMLDSARVVIGTVLKALERDPNTEQLDRIPALRQRLMALHRNVRLYSSRAYLQPLILGDVWLAVGWSTDILPLARRNQRLAVAVPTSGTLTTSDLWVQPAVDSGDGSTANADFSDLTAQWIRFFWQPEVAVRLSLLNAGVSPLLIEQARGGLPAALRTDGVLLPDRGIIDQSAAILPLPPGAADAYRQLWVETRQAAAAERQGGFLPW